MIIPNFTINNSSINAVKAKVELYNGSTLVKTCTCSDFLQDFTVSRVGENNKFFGYGICQKATINLIDLDRALSISKGFVVKAALGDGTNFVYPYPPFYVDEITRDENNNSLSLVCYDKLYQASSHNVSELELTAPYTLIGAANACYSLLGLSGIIFPIAPFSASYSEGANVDGTETIRYFLNAIAEATQTIYYINSNEQFVFKRFDVNGTPVLTITRDDYFTFKSGENVAISAICHATELGNNVIAGNENGIVQYVRDNPFWEKDDEAGNIGSVVEAALSAVSGLSINQFICEDWLGNYLLEIGDKIALITEDGSSITSYVLNDVVTYDGTLSETTQWEYEASESETDSNPSNIGEMLSQTYARVDKANKQIELVVADVDNQGNRLTSLEVNTDGISTTVSSLKNTTEEYIDTINENFETLSRQVSAKVSAEDVQITIEAEMSKGADKVITSTGFTFNDEGLSINKSGSEMTTQITEDGMTILRSGQETLTADNTGVKAENLHATTYLIIGKNSRFEDYGGNRTGCFWIGG